MKPSLFEDKERLLPHPTVGLYPILFLWIAYWSQAIWRPRKYHFNRNKKTFPSNKIIEIGLEVVPEGDEIKELSDEYKEGSENEPEIRRKGITIMEFKRQKTIESRHNSMMGEVEDLLIEATEKSSTSGSSSRSYLPFLNTLNKKIKEEKTSKELKNILFSIRKDVIQRNSYRLDPKEMEEFARISMRNKIANLHLFERTNRESKDIN
jgi:hypothetical protein